MTVAFDPQHSHHAVQFYDDDAFLVDRVAEFLAEGRERGEPCVVIATAEHSEAFGARLRELGHDAAAVMFLDARSTLNQFLDRGTPDAVRFRDVMGNAFREAGCTFRRVRAYGEMVDLLWRDGRPDAAIRLEELWNALASEYTFSLLCAYPMANFYKETDGTLFDAMCATHDLVRPTERSLRTTGDDRDRRIAHLEQRSAALETEIAHRRRLESRLSEVLAAHRRGEELLRDFVDHAAICLHWVMADGTIEWANEAELRLLGYTAGEYIGRNIAEFHADENRINDILCRLTNGEEIRDYEAPVRAKDGSVKWLAISSNALIEDGRFVHTRCFSRDITAQKRLQEQNDFLLRATDVVTRSFDYRTRLNDLAHVCVPQLADWCVIDIARDDGYERLAVAHVDPAVAEHARRVHAKWPLPEDRDPVIAVLRSGEPLLVPHVAEESLDAMAVDDEHRAELRKFAVRSFMLVPMLVQGRVAGVISFAAAHDHAAYGSDDLPLALDLATRAASMIEIARLYHVAELNNRAKDEFLATLSHELRTPLTAVLGWARMMAAGGMDPETLRTAVATIEQSATTQAALIDDLLDVSRIVSGKLSLDSAPVDFTVVVNNVLRAMQVAADAKRIRIEVSGLDERSVVQGDKTRLQQIVWNLVTNAVKFSDQGKRVDVSLSHDNGHVRLIVRDEGRGIAPSFLPFVFEPFRQADSTPTRAHGGLGLGLAIVKYLVEAHGGTVRAHSAGAGKGAAFTVSLPLARRTTTIESEPSVFADLHGFSVLVVDDDKNSRLMLKAALLRCGADVITAASVAEARAHLARRPDAIITDIAMPGEDGIAFAREVRNGETLRHVPVFAVTAFHHGVDVQREFDDFIRKPMDPLDVTRRVAARLRS